MEALAGLCGSYRELREDPAFVAQYQGYLREFAGRPTPLTRAARLTEHLGGAQIYLKREDLTRTGSSHINSALGQGLIARQLGKPRLIAATGSDFHGIATAAVARLLAMECTIYVAAPDRQRQSFSADAIERLGATLVAVKTYVGTLNEACSEAGRDFAANIETTFNVMPSVIGPHPFPMMVRDFQSIIGRELADQLDDDTDLGSLHLLAAVGGGACALGLFYPFLEADRVTLTGVEAAGPALEPGLAAAKLALGTPGVYMGTRTLLLQDRHGQIRPTRSVAADLDFPLVGPELAYHHRRGRISSATVTDEEALSARALMRRLEHLSISLESAHAVAHAVRLAAELPAQETMVVLVSGHTEDAVDRARSGDE
ncbi:MAG: pyridoxal-phosphate dependent enzyme [Gammaproteobacteria bacterium]|nr:pyridoxal-phosphate dependent enzyme [Gammaproteobacteria bacterium]